jgi:hypothetical protein
MWCANAPKFRPALGFFILMIPRLLLFALLIVSPLCAEDITWQLAYDGHALPTAEWNAVGTPVAKLETEGLRMGEDGAGFGYYRAPWQAGEDDEIIVEATVKVDPMAGWQKKPALTVWPWRDGAPVVLQVSDGRHQEGLVLSQFQATTFTDRYIPLDTTNRFHTYRLIIRGTDMQIFVDGQRKVVGQGAFWKPAESNQPFILFGSTAKKVSGSAIWQSVRLGTRHPATPLPAPQLKVTISEPWPIIPERPRQPETRPYLYNLGQGLLLLSVAQGPDAFYEPYGLFKSTDAGKSWSPIAGLNELPTTPLPCLRRPDGGILAMSRWTWLQPDGALSGKTVHLNADATSFTMEDNRLHLPAAYTDLTDKDHTICERHIWNDADGGATMALWTRRIVQRADGRSRTERWSHLVRSIDDGKTWNYQSTIGPGGEPAVVGLNDTEMTAITRGDSNFCFKQMFSHDAGRTWTKPVQMEEGHVMPDLLLMSNGVLACSYGQPASCLMFSLDQGKTWTAHQVISDQVRYNYTSIREISPGRLLYIHDAPKMTCVYVDVERVK